MAGMTGVLGADFNKFTAAVEDAELKLKGFESGAGKVEGALGRMGDRFSGKQIVQEATLMAEVFERAGGASAFTEKELARMSATATEAVAKLQALGKDVPEGIQKIANETKTAEKETSAWSDTIKGLALSFGAMFTARAALDFVSSIAATAGALSDLSAQTRINVEDLQVMGNAMADFGVSTDELGRALFKLSNAIANGDDGVADALLNMGLSLKEVQNLKGEELFTTIQAGLAKLDGSLRDTTAVTLYGEKLGMAMAGAAEGTETAIDAARRLNNIMREDTVQALDSATEAIDKMKGSLAGITANAIAPVAEGFNTLVATFNKGATAWEVISAMAKDFVASNTVTGASTTNLANLIDQLNQRQQQNATVTDAAAAAGGRNAAALDDQAGATKRLREAQAGFDDFVRQTEAAAMIQKQIDKDVAERDAKAIERAAREAEAIQLQQRKLEGGVAFMNHIKDTLRANQEAAAAEKAFEEEQQKLMATTKALGETHVETGQKGKAGAIETAAGYAAVQTQVELTAEAIEAWIDLMQYSAAANAILSRNGLFTTSSQYEAIANLPRRASGGPVSAGQPYLVGEQGPELFIPSANGSIAAGGAAPVINNTFHLVDTESNLARRVGDTIMAQVRAGTQLRTT